MCDAPTMYDPWQLLSLLGDEDFHFHLRGRRGDAGEMFLPAADHDAILRERGEWLVRRPEQCLAMTSEAEPLIVELVRRANAYIPSLSEDRGKYPPRGLAEGLARRWEADFVVLTADRVVRGGVVCFPSNWDFPATVGKAVAEVHGVVPGLNLAIGPRINSLLDGLPVGSAWFRANWGLTRSQEMNQHPSRELSRLDDGGGTRAVWLRMERQMIWRLPKSRGLVFAIRPFHFPLEQVRRRTQWWNAMRRWLQTMPEAMRQYKGFAQSWQHLADGE